MKTVLYLQSSLNASNLSDLDGVCRYAKAGGWCIRTVLYADAAYIRGTHADADCRPDVKGLLDFWKPDGVIAECGAAGDLLDPVDFKPVPVVFLDRIPVGGETCVTSDPEPIAALAAKELLSLGFRSYAYVPFKVRLPWSVKRGEAFERLVKMNGCKFHLFRSRPFADDAETYRAWMREWLVKAPKMYFLDVGLACNLIGIMDDSQLDTHPLRGALFETMVVGELFKRIAHECSGDRIYYYRDSNRNEIDIVEQTGDETQLWEIKSGATFSGDWTKTMERLRGQFGENVSLKVVYGGDESQKRTAFDLRSWREV